jgi:hypothetical protein
MSISDESTLALVRLVPALTVISAAETAAIAGLIFARITHLDRLWHDGRIDTSPCLPALAAPRHVADWYQRIDKGKGRRGWSDK